MFFKATSDKEEENKCVYYLITRFFSASILSSSSFISLHNQGKRINILQ